MAVKAGFSKSCNMIHTKIKYHHKVCINPKTEPEDIENSALNKKIIAFRGYIFHPSSSGRNKGQMKDHSSQIGSKFCYC